MGKHNHHGRPSSDKIKYVVIARSTASSSPQTSHSSTAHYLSTPPRTVQAETLQGRRDAREVQELKATVVELQKQLEEERGRTEEVNGGHGEGGTEETLVAENKGLKREVAALRKKHDRLQADHSSLSQAHSKLSSDLQQSRHQVSLDPHHLDRDKELKQARDIVDSLEVQLKVLTEGRLILLERLEQLEEGWASRAEVERGRERHEAAEGRKKLVAKLVRVTKANAQLADDLTETQNQLHRYQQANGDLRDNNARLRAERQTSDDAAASAQRQLKELVEQMRARWWRLKLSPAAWIDGVLLAVLAVLALLAELSIQLLLRFGWKAGC
ncbi:hypothetical protein JCM1840_005323 [Sporobolomyces johnsonii]